MRIIIDPETCTGCGVCESLCSEVFQIQEDEKAHVIDAEASESCDLQEVVDSCPGQSITIEE